MPRKINPLWNLLIRLDRKLPRKTRGYLVGGGGLVLAFGIPRFTADLDFLETKETRELKRIFESHQEEFKDLGFEIQLIPISWLPLPEDYEKESTVFAGAKFKKLELRFLKTEDLVLAKLARGSSKDLEDIRWLAQNVSLDPEELTVRYRKGRGNVTAGLPRLDSAFLYLMKDLFGRALKAKDLLS